LLIDELQKNIPYMGVCPQDEIGTIYTEELFMPIFRKLLEHYGINAQGSPGSVQTELQEVDWSSAVLPSSEPPKCDCGALKAGTPHIDWCSLND
jgi:hypothetical protein